MTGIPFPNASTRNEARDNAIELAKLAEDKMGVSPELVTQYGQMAAVWADIAQSYPVEDSPWNLGPGQVVEESYHPYPAATDETQVMVVGPDKALEPSGVVTDGPVPISVDSAHWDVLRYLAACYLVNLEDRRTLIDLDAVRERGSTYAIRFLTMPDTPNVHVLYE